MKSNELVAIIARHTLPKALIVKKTDFSRYKRVTAVTSSFKMCFFRPVGSRTHALPQVTVGLQSSNSIRFCLSENASLTVVALRRETYILIFYTPSIYYLFSFSAYDTNNKRRYGTDRYCSIFSKSRFNGSLEETILFTITKLSFHLYSCSRNHVPTLLPQPWTSFKPITKSTNKIPSYPYRHYSFYFILEYVLALSYKGLLAL